MIANRSSKNQQDLNEVFDQIYREHFGRLYFFAVTLTKCEEAAKDVVSEVFVSLWNARANLANIKDIESYLFISVKNQSLNVISKTRPSIASFDGKNETVKEVDGINPEDVLIQKELLDSLNDAIENLPCQCQLVFRLAREQDMTYKQISEELTISEATVKSHMIKAIAEVRHFITRRYGGFDRRQVI